MSELEVEMWRLRLGDELRAIQMANIAMLPDETYEQNLRRRAEMELRKQAILKELSW